MTTSFNAPRNSSTFSPRYYSHPDHPFVIGVTTKCGSTSINRAMRRRKWRCWEKPGEYPPVPLNKTVYLVVRHPLDRLVSAWKYFLLKGYMPGGGSCTRQPPGSFEAFVEYALSTPNMHWTPQTWQHAAWRSYELVRLENLNDWWRDMGLGTLPWDKKTKHRVWQQYYSERLRAQCEAYYAEDLDLWEASA